MILPARLWANDSQPVRLESSVSGADHGHDGKAGFWRCIFASAARQKAEMFSWSGVSNSRGVDHGAEDTFNPANRSTQPFDLSYLKIDSDQAFQVAQNHGGKQLLAKNPQQTVLYVLDWDPRVQELRWHVLYGNSAGSPELGILVNASGGEF